MWSTLVKDAENGSTGVAKWLSLLSSDQGLLIGDRIQSKPTYCFIALRAFYNHRSSHCPDMMKGILLKRMQNFH